MSHFVVSNGHDIWIIKVPGESGHISINQLQLAFIPAGTMFICYWGAGGGMNDALPNYIIHGGAPTNAKVLIG